MIWYHTGLFGKIIMPMLMLKFINWKIEISLFLPYTVFSKF